MFGWSTSAARAGDLIAHDSLDFDPTSSIGSVSSDVQNRLAFTAGWWGLWIGTGDVVARGLTYTNLQVSGNRMVTDGNNSPSWHALYPFFYPDLATNGYYGREGTTLWLSFLYRADSALGTDVYQGLSLFDENVEELFIGATIGSTNLGFHLWDFGAAPNGVTSTRRSALGGTHLLVVRLAFGVSGSSDRVDLYVDPVPGVMPAAPLASRTGANFRFNWIRVQSGYGANRGSFDEIRLGRTYASVTPVQSGPAAFRIDALQPGPFGYVIDFQSAATMPFVLESSVNLIGWAPMFTNTLTRQFSAWLDPFAPSEPSRYYRLRKP